jgi:hypothetical protein
MDIFYALIEIAAKILRNIKGCKKKKKQMVAFKNSPINYYFICFQWVEIRHAFLSTFGTYLAHIDLKRMDHFI